MRRVSIWPAILGLATAVNLILLLQAVGVLDPVHHSLSFVSGGLVILSLIGWVTEAREVAGPPPPEEHEHELEGEEEEEEAPGPSFWPVFLAVGIVGIALGLVYGWSYAALFVSLPVSAAALAFWANDIRQEQDELATTAAVVAAPAPPSEVMPASGGGGLLMPVAPRALAAQAAGGAAIAIEATQKRGVSRRGLLRLTFWTGLGGGLAALGGAMVDALYPRGVTGFGSVVQAGTIDQFPAGTKTHNLEGKFWLVNLTEAQGGPGMLALWHKCPHLGCTVPWREEFVFVDPNSGQSHTGWFRCPCHGSTYNDAGVRVFGPAPRSMDVMALTYDPGSKRISVNSGKITKGSTNNPTLATKV